MTVSQGMCFHKNMEQCQLILFTCRYEARNQLLLNLGLPEVQDYIYDRVSSIIEENDIDYIKWDMNRPYQGMML